MQRHSLFIPQHSVLAQFARVLWQTFKIHFILALVISNFAFSQTPLDELIKEESMLAKELVNKTERLSEIKQETAQVKQKIKLVDSRLLPLEIEMKKLNLEFKKIDVKKSSSREQEEITQLSRIKYRKHILNLKIQVEEETKQGFKQEVSTLHDRESRLKVVVKRLSRKLLGTQSAIANYKDRNKSAVAVTTPAIVTAPVVTPVDKAAIKKPTPAQTLKTKSSTASTSKPAVNKKTTASTSKVKQTSGLAAAVNKIQNNHDSDATSSKASTKSKPIAKAPPSKATTAPVSAANTHSYTPTKLTPEQLSKRQKSINLLLTMDDIPASTKAVIKAKHRALENLQALPNLGENPQVELRYLKRGEQNQVTTLKHLGNNQYMNTLTINSGLQQFHIGELKFTKRIDKVFDGSKAIIIIDAIDLKNPIFEVYPVSLEKIAYFSY